MRHGLQKMAQYLSEVVAESHELGGVLDAMTALVLPQFLGLVCSVLEVSAVHQPNPMVEQLLIAPSGDMLSDNLLALWRCSGEMRETQVQVCIPYSYHLEWSLPSS